MNFLIPSLFLSLFSFFTVFGIRQDLILNQILYFIIGFFVFFAAKKLGLSFFRNNASLFYWLFIILLIITYIIGLEVKGSRRWIDLYFFKFQASEFFKIFFILFLSEILVQSTTYLEKITIFLKSIFYFILPTLIIFKQPDLGNAMVFVFIFFAMILFSELPKKYLLYFLLISTLSIPTGWLLLKDYQKQRLFSFLNPHIDTQGTAYNMIQAVITVGSGKFFGRGLGLGTQSRLYFLPENYTDFAFASAVEQFGFLGGLAVLGLYLTIVIFLIKKALSYFYQKNEEEKKNFLYLIGFISYFIFQIFVNIGMNTGIFPITGIALPFISYGGSSVVALLFGLALIP